MENFEKKIVEQQPFPDLKVMEARFDQALIFGNDGSLNNKPVLEIELTVEGRKRPVRKSVIYSHCPFCGVDYAASNKPTESEVANG